MSANKKQSKETKVTVDNPALSVATYLGITHAKTIEVTGPCRIIQNADKARCSGATIWIETDFESLTIDGVPADKSIFEDRNKHV
jgi:hypothetical protein